MSMNHAPAKGGVRAYLHFLKRDFIRYRGLYFMFLPVIV